MHQLPNDPVIVKFARTPIGKYAGALKNLRPDDMMALLLNHFVMGDLAGHRIDEVIIGCANQAGEDNRNIARMSLLLAGLGDEVPGITLNRLCASGLDAVIDGARKIVCGEHELVLAGGVESMTRAPWVMPKSDQPFKLGAPQIFDSSLGWRFFNEKMMERTPPEHNGVTAEALVKKYDISRERQDEFALKSHRRAIEAQNSGWFSKEILPVSMKLNAREEILVAKDEGPRSDCNIESLKKLSPAFVKDGTVTAGNSSTLNDGAALLAIASHDYAKKMGLAPLARISGFAAAGVNPRIMGIGPVFSTKKLLEKYHFQIDDFSIIEINEAFAAQVLAVTKELKIDENRVNLWGGAIALGHPLGCSGARLVGTAVNQLREQKKSLGLVSLCVGVGQGVSLALEAI